MNNNDNGCDNETFSISAFVTKQRELLELELQAENDVDTNTSTAASSTKSSTSAATTEQDERPTNVLGQLEATDISVGLYGRTVVQLSTAPVSVTSNSKNSNGDRSSGKNFSTKGTPILLPGHRFTVGDEVEIRGKGGGGDTTNKTKSIGGVVSAVSDTFITVALFENNSNSHKQNRQTSTAGNKTISKKQQQRQRQQKTSNTVEDDDETINNMLQQVPLTLVPKSSVEVHRKMVAALQTLEKHGVDHPVAGDVIRCMFYPSQNNNLSTSTRKSTKLPVIQPYNPNLDHSQLEAIEFALDKDRKVALIHGPPGTGKTTTIAELIQQAVHHHGMRVLVTAPSNVAVDNILERLAQNNSMAALSASSSSTSSSRKNKASASSSSSSSTGYQRLKMVRLGHPARIKSSVVGTYSLEALVQSADGTEIVRDVRNELQSFLKLLSNPKSKGQDKRIAYRELKTLRKEIRTREERVVKELISSANVVLTTTVGASNRALNNREGSNDTLSSSDFDLVIIDEAAQALEASCWIPILRGKKVVLAGDHLQLPPTIKSKDRRAVVGLGRTMFERLMGLYDKAERSDVHAISRMLKIQYRMHHLIADWASQTMYNGELQTHESVRSRTLLQLPAVMQHLEAYKVGDDGAEVDRPEPIETTTLLLVDTAGCDMHEGVTSAGSRYNEGEASLVAQHARDLLGLGLHQEDIAVISPYNGQCELLRSLLLPDFPKLEIRSVDGFQGGEKEAVILSLVRSSDRALNGIGFLRDDRRLNVGVTRAKRHLAVFCDTETVSKSSFIQSLINWVESHGDHRSAIEYTMKSSTIGQDYENDLKAAEELLVMAESSVAAKTSQGTSKASTHQSQTTVYDKTLAESKRKALMDKIAMFADTAKDGEELTLSSELTSYDRRLVHEFAEQNGLLHRSEGTDGVDRRVILTAQKEMSSIEPPLDVVEEHEESRQNQEQTGMPIASSNFAALAIDDESDDDSDGVTEEDKIEKSEPQQSADPEIQSQNALLSQLARERAARQELSRTNAPSTTGNTGAKKNKKKKPKGQRLGGGPPPIKEVEKNDSLDDLDDMAFLDAQIEKNDNAHGRRVTGSGKQYRTVINGILNSRPEPPQKQTNTKASKMLQAKLRDAQSARKTKQKKKK